MKYLTKFTTAADYAQAKDDLYAPNVSLLNDSKSINYKPIDLPIITVVFDITDISEETCIIWSSEPEEVVAGIEIDGVELQTLVDRYQFSTTGEHIIKYTLKDRKKVEDYMLYNCTDIKSIIIPNCVKEIGEGSFRGCNKATSVTIPNGVEIIGYRAFRFWQALTSITLPNSVTTLKGNTFYDCPQLTTVKLSKNLISCGDNEFYNCNNLSDIENNIVYADCFAVKATNKTLSSYTLREGTKFLDSNCFSECANITSIGPKGSNASLELPNDIKHIGTYCFDECSGLTSVKLPDNAMLGMYCFYNCTGLTSIGPKGSNASLELPNNLTIIEGNCFDKCTNITDIVLPSSIIEINYSAFQNCTNLVSVTLPEGIENIESCAFKGCSKLKTINIPSSVTSIGNNTFDDCTSLPIENNIRYADIYPTKVMDKTLSSYTLKNNVKSLSNSLFSGCTNMTSIDLPNTLRNIESYCFNNCSSLTSIDIPDSVTSIGYGAFYNCTGLTNCIIGNGVTSINYNAFYGCTNLTSITVKSVNPPILSNNVFSSTVVEGRKIYVPAESVDAYKAANYWSSYAADIEAIQ